MRTKPLFQIISIYMCVIIDDLSIAEAGKTRPKSKAAETCAVSQPALPLSISTLLDSQAADLTAALYGTWPMSVTSNNRRENNIAADIINLIGM